MRRRKTRRWLVQVLIFRYTACNDVSSRVQQFATSQWSYSKSFDGACPIGPAFVPRDAVSDIKSMAIEGSLNGKTVQKSTME